MVCIFSDCALLGKGFFHLGELRLVVGVESRVDFEHVRENAIRRDVFTDCRAVVGGEPMPIFYLVAYADDERDTRGVHHVVELLCVCCVVCIYHVERISHPTENTRYFLRLKKYLFSA